MVGGTYLSVKISEKRMTLTEGKLKRRTILNTMGFVFGATGVGLLIGSLVMQKKWGLARKTKDQSSLEFGLGFSINSATMNVSF